MSSFESVRLLILQTLSALRSDFLRPSAPFDNVDEVIDASHKIETLRVLVSAVGRRRDTLPPEYISRMITEASALRSHPFFVKYSQRRLRQSPGMEELAAQIKTQFDNNATLADGIALLIDIFGSIDVQDELPLALNQMQTLDRLSNIVPIQKVAPAQFFIDQEKLKVLHAKNSPDHNDLKNIQNAREALLEQSANIIENLRISNCDRRLLEAVQRLDAKLRDNTDIVQLGVQNITCDELRASFEPELPIALAAMIKGHTSAINLYVAQFPEWQRFADNAAQLEFNPEDVKQLREVANDLAASLEDDECVEPEVPETIKFLAAAIKNPLQTSKRTAFALLRSLENLFSVTFKYVGETAKEIGEQTKKTVAKSISRVIGGFAALILASAIAVAPIYGKFADTAWMKTAAPLVQNLLGLSSK